MLTREQFDQWSKHRLFWVIANAVAIAMLVTLYRKFGFVDMNLIQQARASADPVEKLMGDTAIMSYCIFSISFFLSAVMALFGRDLK